MKQKRIYIFIFLLSMVVVIVGSIVYDGKNSNNTVQAYKEAEKKIIIEPLVGEFNIIYPEKDNIKTSEKVITIYGESDPNKELMLNGKKVDVYYTGNFIESIELVDGINTLVFKMGNHVKKLKVEKEFNIISSIHPTKKLKIEEEKEFTISAKLYNGAKGHVEIGKEKYDLVQVQTLKDISAKGTTYADYVAKGITSLNINGTKIKVVATLNDVTQEMDGGEVTITKKQDKGFKLGELINDSVMIYDDNTLNTNPLVEKSSLPKGTIDYILSETVVDSKEYYNLKSGERVKKEDVKIKGDLEEPSKNSITDLQVYDEGKYTFLKLKTKLKVPFSLEVQPIRYKEPVVGDYTIDNYSVNQGIITFSYTEGIDECAFKDNRLFSSIKSSGNEIILNFKNKGGYYGHYSFYDKEGYLNIRFQNKVSSLRDTTIILDPGHGFSGSEWKDTGALGWNGINEHDLNLKITTLLEEELTKKGAKVIRLKTEEKTYLLKDRGRVARENNGDLFISIHHNSGGFGKLNATETYYNTPFSMELAKSINESLVSVYENMMFDNIKGDYNRGAKNNWFMVTTEKECPSVLVEVGYIDNPKAFNKFIDKVYQEEIVKGIIEGIEKYCYNN